MEVQRAHQTRERSRPPSTTQSKPTHSRNPGHCSAPPDTYATSRDALGRKAARRLKVLSAEDVLGELFRKEDALQSLRILAKTGTGVICQEEIPQEIPPQPLSPSSSQYSRTSTRTWSSQGLEERVGSSFLRMAFEEEEEQEEEHDLSADTVLTDREYDSRPLDVRPAGIVLPAAPIPSSCPAPSSEVSVLYLDELEEHASDSKKGHPYSVSCLESKRSVTATRSSASSAKQSVSSRSSSSASALSYALKEDEAYSRPFAMEHISKSTEVSTICRACRIRMDIVGEFY
ncbi:hypothetical protein EV361DRAFT_875490 [Lentinula raphanica]|nr:hypothetical protein EV361DRAFT_875490 [Lentinula raphanica]